MLDKYSIHSVQEQHREGRVQLRMPIGRHDSCAGHELIMSILHPLEVQMLARLLGNLKRHADLDLPFLPWHTEHAEARLECDALINPSVAHQDIPLSIMLDYYFHVMILVP